MSAFPNLDNSSFIPAFSVEPETTVETGQPQDLINKLNELTMLLASGGAETLKIAQTVKELLACIRTLPFDQLSAKLQEKIQAEELQFSTLSLIAGMVTSYGGTHLTTQEDITVKKLISSLLPAIHRDAVM
jgi:hypothetical protein